MVDFSQKPFILTHLNGRREGVIFFMADPKTNSLSLAELPTWARPHFETDKRFHCVVAHRKAKKTKSAFTYLIWKAIQTPASYWYIAQSYSISRENIWENPYMLSSLPQNLLIGKDAKQLMWRLRTVNGKVSRIYLKGGDRPDLMRGPTPFGVVIDEYATLKKEIWDEVISPIIFANPSAWVWIQGTFKGPNHLYLLYNQALKNPQQWETTFLKASESGILSPEALKQAKTTMRKEIYLQEYENAVIEGGASFFRRVDEVVKGKFENYNPNYYYVAGVDFGRLVDATVAKVFNMTTNAEAASLEIINESFERQCEQLSKFLDKYNCYAYCDASSMGGKEAISVLAKFYNKVEGLQFNQKTKSDYLENLAIFIENKYLSLTNEDYKLIAELKSFQYDVTDKGTMIIGTQKGHDDHVIATALAVYQLQKRKLYFQPQEDKTPKELEKEELQAMIKKSISILNGSEFDNRIQEEYNDY